jgi:hypothetical protein
MPSLSWEETRPSSPSRRAILKLIVRAARKGNSAKKKPKRLRREYGPSYFAEKMSGLTAAVKRVAREEQAMLNFDPTGKTVN